MVVRLGKGKRAQYEDNCARTLDEWGFSAFSVRAARDMTVDQIQNHPPKGPWKERVVSVGRDLRLNGMQSRKTGNDPLHFSVLCPDGITDEVWGILERTFQPC